MLFESKEEKQAKKEKKFEEKLAKIEARDQKNLAKYHLQSLTNPGDIDSVRTIITELAGTGIMELGITLGGGNDRDIQKQQMYFLRAIVEQNFILIRQNDRIEKLLEAIADSKNGQNPPEMPPV